MESLPPQVFGPRWEWALSLIHILTGISIDADKEEIAAVFDETGYSRLPVYKETIDDITGIIYQKDFYNRMYRGT